MKGVSIVDHRAFAQNFPSAHSVAHAQLVGGRLQTSGRRDPSWAQIRG